MIGSHLVENMRQSHTSTHATREGVTRWRIWGTESHIHIYHKRGSHLVENMKHRVTHPHIPQERESSGGEYETQSHTSTYTTREGVIWWRIWGTESHIHTYHKRGSHLVENMRHRVTHPHIPQERESPGGEYGTQSHTSTMIGVIWWRIWDTESHIHTYHKRGSHLVENMRHRVTHPHIPQERESSGGEYETQSHTSTHTTREGVFWWRIWDRVTHPHIPQERESSGGEYETQSHTSTHTTGEGVIRWKIWGTESHIHIYHKRGSHLVENMRHRVTHPHIQHERESSGGEYETQSHTSTYTTREGVIWWRIWDTESHIHHDRSHLMENMGHRVTYPHIPHERESSSGEYETQSHTSTHTTREGVIWWRIWDTEPHIHTYHKRGGNHLVADTAELAKHAGKMSFCIFSLSFSFFSHKVGDKAQQQWSLMQLNW